MIRTLFTVLGPQHARPLRRMLAGIVAGAVLQGLGFVLLVPLLRALLAGDGDRAWAWLGAQAAVAALYGVVHYVSQAAGYETGAALSRTLHHRLGDHIAALPLGWFRADRVGRLGQLLSKGVTDIQGVPAHLLRPVVTGFVTPATVVAAMFLFDWRLALAAALTAPVAALVYRWSGDLVARADHGADAAAAEAGGRVVEFAQTQPVLRAFGRTAEGHALLDDALVAQRDAGRRLLVTALPGLVAFVVVVQAAFTVVLLLGTNLALGGSIEVAELIALLVLAARFVEPMVVAADLGGALRMARNSLGRIDEVLAAEPLPEPEAPRQPSGAAIELDRVSFAYGDRPVLDGVSLRVPERTMTALVGPSGSGKTTVTRLVARFWDVDAGTVRVGGCDVRDLTTADLMRQLSLVFQDVYLFEGSVEDNVRVGRPGASDAEVRAAARLARVDEIVERLPQGWATPVGEGGATLSGGERQRVSIARALLKDAPIVLLDEATAALDPENEAAVQDALSALVADRTLLVIAHRLQTVMAADQIVVLEGGRVAETGTHDQLLAAGGRYADFWRERHRAQGWRIGGGAQSEQLRAADPAALPEVPRPPGPSSRARARPGH